MIRKNAFLSLCLLMLVSGIASGQQKKDDAGKKPEYKFTTVKELPVTSIKDQYRSGTCWCFSALSFLESELLRTQGKTYDLSEMWVIGHSYSDRATKFVRLDGKMGFSAGSGFSDVFAVFDKYGIATQEAYPGMLYGTEKPEQAELDAVLLAYVKAVNEKRGKVLSTAWKKGFDAVVQAYLGTWPDTFKYEGKDISPVEFRDKVVKFNSSDYVNICSFSDAPLHRLVPVEVCDNWRNADAYNVTMKEMIEIMYYAMDHGYTVLWGGDVSEKSFSRKGIATMPVPDTNKKNLEGTDQANWVGKEEDGKKAEPQADGLPKEIEVTDSLRLSAFNRKMTTDDHGMHIFGYAVDQEGHKFFKVKNSWGETGTYKGIWYMSEAFISYKTLNFVIHKDALPKDMKKKLGIK